MKILMLCDFFDEKLEYQENLLAKYYVKNGHEVVIIAAPEYNIFDYYSEKFNLKSESSFYYFGEVKIYKLRYRWLFLMNKLRRLDDISDILLLEKPDLIFVHDISLNIMEAVRYVKKNKLCKIIMDFHSDYSNSASNWLSLNILHKLIKRRLFLDRAQKYISKFYPVVPASFTFLNEVYNVPLFRMELLPLGGDTDLAEMVKNGNIKNGLRNEIGIAEDDFVIFSGGKFKKEKKIEKLIGAINKLNNNKLHLIIIGDAGPEEQDYKKEILTLAFPNKNIHFTGWLNSLDIYRYLGVSDMAVFPASQSILWQQSICMNLPLIVGNVGNQSIEYLNKYKNIIMLEKNDISEDILAFHIDKLMSQKEILYNMRIGAEKVSGELLNWNSIIQKTLETIN